LSQLATASAFPRLASCSVENSDFWEKYVLGQVLYDFECLLMFENYEINYIITFGHWGVKIGIFGEKWSKSRSYLVLLALSE